MIKIKKLLALKVSVVTSLKTCCEQRSNVIFSVATDVKESLYMYVFLTPLMSKVVFKLSQNKL